MTCIAAIKTADKIIVGADRCITMDETYCDILDYPKIIKFSDHTIMGVAGRIHELNIIRDCFEMPDKLESLSVPGFVHKTVIPEIQELFTNYKIFGHDNEHHCDATILLATYGQLFRITYDYSVSRHSCDFMAVGTGRNCALGSLYSTPDLDPKRRIELALQSAERFCPEVKRPFDFLEIKLNSIISQVKIDYTPCDKSTETIYME